MRCAARSPAQFDTPELGWRFLRFHHSFRSGANVLGVGRPRVQARERSIASITADDGGVPPNTSRCPTPRPAWSSCGR